MKRQVLQLLLFFILIPKLSLAQRYIVYSFERVIKVGDDMRWADPDFDHSDWDYSGFTDSIGNFWVRFKVRCDSITDTFTHPGLQVISQGSYEAYWDGVLLGESGKVGRSKEEEIPGPFLSQIAIPDSLFQHGIHVVAFRVSNYHWPQLGIGNWNLIYMEDYRESMKKDLILTAKNFILAGIYLMAALYYLFLYLLRKREAEGLIFSAMCFLFFGLIVMEYIKFIYAYPYPFHLIRLATIYVLTLAISFLTPLFFILYFKLPHWKWLSIGILGLLLIIGGIFLPGTDYASMYSSLIMWCSSLGIVLYAVFRKRKESWIILSAILSSGAIVFLYNIGYRGTIYSYDVTLFISFSILVLSMMYLLARRAKVQKEAYEASLLLSSRLQNELLKKNIQPHFIMNTLTSLMGWIEESPKDSVQFIEALSKEFEIVSEIAEKKLIPIEREIDLCRYHIEIMKYRKEIDYQFECKNIQAGEMIPPAVFHTIIENGITHSIPDANNQIRMVLSFSASKNYKCYELATFAQNRKSSNKKGGTGFKYIQSRLIENYGDDWTLESHATQHGWLTTICVSHKS